MDRGKWARALVLMPLLGIVTTGGPLLQPSFAAGTADPHLASGTVVDDSGAPVANARVTASVEQDVQQLESATYEHELARAYTDTEGRFDLAGTLDAPATWNSDGSVRIQLEVLTSQRDRYYLLNLLPPSSSRTDWTWTEAPDMKVLAPGTSDVVQVASGQVEGLVMQVATGKPVAINAAADVLPNPDGAIDGGTEPASATDTLDTNTDSAGASRASDLAIAAAKSSCEYDVWKDTDNYKFRGGPVQYWSILNRSTELLDWSTTTETKLSVAYTGSGTNYNGGLSQGFDSSQTSGFTKSFTDDYTTKFYRTQWRYREQALYCFEPYAYRDVDTGQRRWRPSNFTGQAAGNATSYSWACQPQYEIQTTVDSLYFQTNKTINYTGWFEILGVKLDISQSHGNQTKVAYQRRPAFGYMKLCGKGADPALSFMVREVS